MLLVMFGEWVVWLLLDDEISIVHSVMIANTRYILIFYRATILANFMMTEVFANLRT